RGCSRPRVVGLDRLDRSRGLVDRLEYEQGFAGRQNPLETRVLCDDGSARREVGGRPVAEPAASKAHVLVLRDGELAPRAADVVAIRIGVGREVEGVPDPPAAALEQLLVLQGVAGERELEPATGAPRKGQELPELL